MRIQIFSISDVLNDAVRTLKIVLNLSQGLLTGGSIENILNVKITNLNL